MAAVAHRSAWQRWFPAADPDRPGYWRLIRFDEVGGDGKPVGKAIVNTSPGNQPRTFINEKVAQNVADFINQEEGR